jgi:amidase
MALSPVANIAGTPSISLPMGFDEEKHLPAGLLFDADYGQDALLLQLALELEQARPWRTLAD